MTRRRESFSSLSSLWNLCRYASSRKPVRGINGFVALTYKTHCKYYIHFDFYQIFQSTYYSFLGFLWFFFIHKAALQITIIRIISWMVWLCKSSQSREENCVEIQWLAEGLIRIESLLVMIFGIIVQGCVYCYIPVCFCNFDTHAYNVNILIMDIIFRDSWTRQRVQRIETVKNE